MLNLLLLLFSIKKRQPMVCKQLNIKKKKSYTTIPIQTLTIPALQFQTLKPVVNKRPSV